MSDQTLSDVRPSPIAGTWYPGVPERLAATVDQLMEQAAPVSVPGRIVGLVVPHAGYRYSGAIAACAFAPLRGSEIERVVIVSPMHDIYPDPVLTTAHEAYETPLGVIPVDRETLKELGQQFRLASVRRDHEHSLEIELPFLQRALKQPFKLVPIMLRDQTYAAAEIVGTALARVLGSSEQTLLVASSDLSHFYPDKTARQLDRVMLDRVAAFDPQGVIRVEEERRGFACGRAAIAVVLVAARALGADSVQIVGYSTSADSTGDTQRVVGYGSAVIYRAA